MQWHETYRLKMLDKKKTWIKVDQPKGPIDLE